MNIAIDIDDVLANFQSSFIQYYNSRFETNFKLEEMIDYRYVSTFGKPWDEMKELLYDFFSTDDFANLEAVEYSTNVVPKLSNIYDLYVITARPESVEGLTRVWLDRNFPNSFTKVIHTNKSLDKFNKKSSVCLEYSIQSIIEDSPMEVEDFVSNGISVHILEKPWNKHIKESKNVSKHVDWMSVEETMLDLN